MPGAVERSEPRSEETEYAASDTCGLSGLRELFFFF